MTSALDGGAPAFPDPLHVGRPNLGDRERLMERIGGALDRLWLSNNGPLVLELEERIARDLGVRHAFTVCNATVGLEVAIRAAALSGEVIVPSYTFVATAHAVQWLGLTPVFADVDPVTHVLDPASVEALVTERTSAIIGVHVWGQPCPVAALQDIADRHGLRLMFDAAHAYGCSLGGAPIGGFGDAEVFSFHATKFVNSFEGGAVTTNDDALAERIRLMRNFGFAGTDLVVAEGTNAKMTEVCAAMGLTSLESLDEIVRVNRRNYHIYRDGLAALPGVRFFEYDEAEANNFQYVVLEVDEAEAGISRDDVVRALHADNVLARRYFAPGVHRMEPYVTLQPDAGAHLPVTEALVEKSMLLPSGTAVSADDARTIVGLMRAALADPERVRRALRPAVAVA